MEIGHSQSNLGISNSTLHGEGGKIDGRKGLESQLIIDGAKNLHGEMKWVHI